MDLLEGGWFLTSFLIIAIVLLVDPKSSLTNSSSSSVLGLFSSPSSGQQFIYKFSAILIGVFFILTLSISLGS
jgi:protein translocase SecG subunit